MFGTTHQWSHQSGVCLWWAWVHVGQAKLHTKADLRQLRAWGGGRSAAKGPRHPEIPLSLPTAYETESPEEPQVVCELHEIRVSGTGSDTDSNSVQALGLRPLSNCLRVHPSQPPPSWDLQTFVVGKGHREWSRWGQKSSSGWKDQYLALWREGSAQEPSSPHPVSSRIILALFLPAQASWRLLNKPCTLGPGWGLLKTSPPEPSWQGRPSTGWQGGISVFPRVGTTAYFLMYAFIAVNFSLCTPFPVSYKFGYVVLFFTCL